MPKKKRTRAGRTKLSRPAKTVEEQMGDISDISMCSGISEGLHSKEELLAMFLQDFDNGVEKRVKQIRAAMAKLITEQRNILKMEMLKIPMEIRQMKMTDFLKAGGSMDALMLNGADALSVDDAISAECQRNPLEEIPVQSNNKSTVPRQTIKRATRSTKTPMTSKTEGRVTRGKMRAMANAINETPAAKQVNDFVTPMNPVIMSKFSFKTPMITPKFDLSNPVTTSRRPKLGETLVSLAGSPVMSLPRKQDKAIGLTIEDGQSPKIVGSLLEMSPNSLVDKEQQLIKLRSILDSKIQQIGKATTSGNP